MTGQLLPQISETVFQTRIIELCAWLDLKWHHETDSRRSRRGFPDLVIVGPHWRRIVFAELKREKNSNATDEQREWLEHLDACGIYARLWRPSDWSEINRVLHALAGRPCPREYA